MPRCLSSSSRSPGMPLPVSSPVPYASESPMTTTRITPSISRAGRDGLIFGCSRHASAKIVRRTRPLRIQPLYKKNARAVRPRNGWERCSDSASTELQQLDAGVVSRKQRLIHRAHLLLRPASEHAVTAELFAGVEHDDRAL